MERCGRCKQRYVVVEIKIILIFVELFEVRLYESRV